MYYLVLTNTVIMTDCHLRRLRQVRRRVGKDITIRLVLAVIMSRLDYCNSVLAGLPQSTLQPLQRVQNAAARLICDVPYHEHITAHLHELHWLPVRLRIEYKLCLTMYNVHNVLLRHVPAGRYSMFLTVIGAITNLQMTMMMIISKSFP